MQVQVRENKNNCGEKQRKNKKKEKGKKGKKEKMEKGNKGKKNTKVGESLKNVWEVVESGTKQETIVKKIDKHWKSDQKYGKFKKYREVLKKNYKKWKKWAKVW